MYVLNMFFMFKRNYCHDSSARSIYYIM